MFELKTKKPFLIHVVISRLWCKIKLWNLRAESFQLDMDMQCCNMSYKDYKEDRDLISFEKDKVLSELNDL